MNLAKTHKQRAIAVLLCGVWIGASTPLLAQVAGTTLPTGGTVTSGAAQISSTAGQMTVTQTTAQTQINWNAFNIGSNASVVFRQPNAAAVAVNRVLSSDPSSIYGSLSANGNVFLVNPNGVYFAPGSRVDVGGLVASAMDLSGSKAGQYTFTATGTAGVVNDGSITAGNVALIGPSVTNNGTITAMTGNAALASGGAVTLTFGGNGQMAISVDKATLAAAMKNKGAIIAPNGQAILTGAASDSLVNSIVNAPESAALVSVNGVPTLVSNEGQIKAKSVVISAGTNAGVNVTGTVDASSSTGVGGQIAITGQEITLGSTARLNANGATGGGAVLVGGDWQGSGSLPQSTYVTIDGGAQLSADALTSGAGGRIVAWSDITNAASVTSVHGSLSATSASGTGGQIETSGHVLDVSGATVTTKGAQVGTWLLDPYNITIDSSTTTTGAAPSFTATADSTIKASDITAALASNNVTITTGAAGSAGSSSGDITVNSALAWNSANSLSLTAANNIAINASIQNSGAGGVTLNAGNNVTIGSTTSSAMVAVGSATGDTSVTAAQNVTLQGSDTGTGSGAQIGYNYTSSSSQTTAPTGNITVTATNGDVSVNSGKGTAAFAQIGDGGYQASNNVVGNIGGANTTITVTAGRDVTLNANPYGSSGGPTSTGATGSYAYSMIGNGGEQTDGSHMGDVFANISVTANRAAVLYGGFYGSYAQIGNGGGTEENAIRGTTGGTITLDAKGTSTDTTTLNAATNAVPESGSITLNSPHDQDEAYVQVGHGGVIDQSKQGNISGNINVTGTKTLLMVSSAVCTSPCLPTGDKAYVQIGHGGLNEHSGSNAVPPTISNSTLTINVNKIDTQGDFRYDPLGSRIATPSSNTGTTVNVISTTTITTQAAGSSTGTQGGYSYAAGTTTTNVSQSGNGTSSTSTAASSPTITRSDDNEVYNGTKSFSVPVTSTSNATVKYTSSDPTVATVDASGKVTFLKLGSVTITASQDATGAYTAASKTYTVSLAAANATLAALSDETTTYGDTNVPATQTTSSASTGAITYTSSDPSVASVDATTGKVTYLKPGKAVITASQAGDSFHNAPAAVTYNVTVKAADTALAPLTDNTVVIGAQPATETTSSKSSGTITYSSSDPTVASVDPTSGKVTFLKPGNAVITASQAGDTYYNAPAPVSYNVTVKPAAGATQPQLAATALNPLADTTVVLGAQPATETTSSQSSGAITYSSSDPSVASVDPASGKVTFLKPGTAVITATQAADTSYDAPAPVSYTVTVKDTPFAANSTQAPSIYHSGAQGNGSAVSGDGALGAASGPAGPGLSVIDVASAPAVQPNAPLAPNGAPGLNNAAIAGGGLPVNTGLQSGPTQDMVFNAQVVPTVYVAAPAASTPSLTGIDAQKIQPIALTPQATFDVPLPSKAFVAKDPKSVLSYTAKLQNGGALPSWITFDVKKFALRGQVPASGARSIVVDLTARDQFGNTAQTKVEVNLK